MICILATIKVKEGKEDLFEKTFIDLSREVRENEKGNIFYQISKDRDEPRTYIVMEHYIDQEEKQTDWLQKLLKQNLLMTPFILTDKIISHLNAV